MGPLSLSLSCSMLRVASIKLTGSLSLKISSSLQFFQCECGSVSFDSSHAIHTVRLNVRSVSAPFPTSSFYFVKDLSVSNLTAMKCPFLMRKLEVLQVSQGTNDLVREFLAMAPNLKTLSLMEAIDWEFDASSHGKIRKVLVKRREKVVRVEVGEQAEVVDAEEENQEVE